MSWVAAGALVLAVVGLRVPPAAADSAPQDPADPRTPPTVTADGLPTVQIDGVVWSQAIVGGRVYAGGSFSTARPAGSPAGTNTVSRKNMLAFDLQTGSLITSFAPSFNAQVLAVAASPDQSRIYVGGDFTSVDGVTRKRIAAFDASTGALVSSFAPSVNSSVEAIVATNTTVYAGGDFQGVGNVNRSGLAAFSASNGALLGWAPQATGGEVRALAMSPDGSKLAVGGSFTALNGSSNPGYGLGAVNAATGALVTPFAINSVVRNAGTNAAITGLSTDGDYIYGSAYDYGGYAGSLEGVFSAGWDGSVHWVNDCHGDTYSVQPEGGAVYVAGHSHTCADIGAFPDTQPDQTYHRAVAFGKQVTGVSSTEADQPRYTDFTGQPVSSLLTWLPTMSLGTYTGQYQGPWSVTGNDKYVVMGGEFPKVNGVAQQGLVRFAVPGIAPNAQGPQLSGSAYPIKVRTFGAGTARVSWTANYDLDNDYLTYRVYRDSQTSSGLVHTRSVRAQFWNLPTMGFTDTGLVPGSTHKYQVVASDPFGNTVSSPWVSVTVAGSGTAGSYLNAVLGSEPEYYWRLGEPSGSTAADSSGFGDATVGSGVTRGVTGALAGDTNTASHFNGTSSGFASTTRSESPPNVFSLEAWFRTTSSSGGKIVGFGDAATGTSTKADRHVYLDNAGHVLFGVNPGVRTAVKSAGTYRDGRWHQVTATLGPDGMKLYVDGALVAQDASVTVGQNGYWGYWRVGGDTLASWPSAPSSGFLNGDIDEVAVYKHVLTGSDVSAHYAAGVGTAPPANNPPTASFTSSVSDLAVSVDGSGSRDSDGSVVSYAWDFGDGGTASGATASHTYAAGGTYSVKLTVTDDKGATGSVTQSVTVTAPPPLLPFATDSFERIVTGGWGSADTGGAWTRNGSSTNFSVANGVGTIRMASAGAGPGAYLAGVSSSDTDVRVQVSLDKAATGGGTYLTVQPRLVGGDQYYADLHYVSDGSLTLALGRIVGSTQVGLQERAVAGVAVQPGDRLQIRVQATGTSPTTLRAKVWKVGSAEPADWTVAVTDSSASLQAAGGIGLATYLSRSATNAPVTASFDNLSAGHTG